jgi:hypothetical protein
VDNSANDEWMYEIHVFTGFEKNSHTMSNVFFNIGGSDGVTGVRPLDDGHRKVVEYEIFVLCCVVPYNLQGFSQGEMKSFLMTSPISLGTPLVFHIWHDNTGERLAQDWYLTKIILIDKTARKW